MAIYDKKRKNKALSLKSQFKPPAREDRLWMGGFQNQPQMA